VSGPTHRHDAGKPRLDLLPFDAILGVGAALEYGAAKYSERNWERGLSASWRRRIGTDDRAGAKRSES
jgi:hypothetical protein